MTGRLLGLVSPEKTMFARPRGARVVRFANVELDLLSGELSRDGSRVLLAQQTFRLLLTLLRDPGVVITREELQRELWSDGTFVDFELSLNAAVKRLREALGDSASAPRFIETIPRRGYRFIATVEYPPASPAGVESPALSEPVGGEDTAAARLSHPPWARLRRFRQLTLNGTAILVLGGALIALAFGLGRPRETAVLGGPKITKVTNLGTVRLASVSADGRQVAYVESDGVRESLWIRPIEESMPIPMVEPVHGTFLYLTVGSDGFVYYSLFEPTRTAAALHRVSVTTQAHDRVSPSASMIRFSRDGSKLAYIETTSMSMQESHLVIGDANWTNLRILAVRRAPETFVKEIKPAWSPDGSQLAVLATSRDATRSPDLLFIDARDGHVRGTRTLPFADLGGIAWLADGDRLVVAGRERRVAPRRLWIVSIATGERRPLTDGLSDYSLAGVSPDGRRVFAVREDVVRTFWVADTHDLAGARQVAAHSGNLGGLEGIAVAGHCLYYAAADSDNVDIWSVDTRTSSRQKLTADPADDYQPTVSADGRTIAFVSTRSGMPSIWSMSSSGTDLRQLTTGRDSRPSLAPDGRWIAFQRDAVDTLPFAIWRVSLDTGESTALGTSHTMRPAVSPDGRMVAHYWMTPEHWMLAVTPATARQPSRTFPISGTHLERVVKWSPDGRHLAFIDGAGGVSNIWLQPLAGDSSRQLTSFPEGTITTFDWARDGSKLAWVRTTHLHDVVSIDLESAAPSGPLRTARNTP